MQLSFVKSKSSLRVELRDGKGNLKTRASSKFAHEKDFLSVAEQLDIDPAMLRYAIDAFERGGPQTIDLGKRQHTVHIRGLHSATGQPYHGDSAANAFAAAIAATELEIEEPIIYWDNCNDLAALDLDAAPGYEYDDAKLLTLEGVPTPEYAWVTKSGGLRLIYKAEDLYTAEEVAAIAYLCLLNTPHESLEIKHDTRHPAYTAADGSACGQVVRRTQQFDASYLRRWLNMFSIQDSEVADYLQKRGLEQGVHYDHTHCPIDPGRESHGKPVNVLDKGIHCFSCEAHGVAAGSSKPGFFPFTHLCGSVSSSVLYRCMENAVHWEQARFVIESKLGVSGHYATLIYSAGMLLHGYDRKMTERVFTAGKNFIRMSDRWTNLNGETYSKDIKPLLASLPTCCVPPKMLPNRPKIAIFEQPFDLSRYGYPSIKPVYGMRIWGQFLEDKDITAVIQTRSLSDESMVNLRPRYVAPEKRRSNYWEEIERAYPGTNRNYIKLLIAARGIAEGGTSMPPIIFVTGPSGAGKSLSVHLAATICGDDNSEVIWTPNIDRVRQSIMDSRGAFVTFNEAMKGANESLAAMDFILNLTPDSMSHYMYLGPMRLGQLPVIVLSDTNIATRVKQDAQLARRITHVQLTGAVDWESTMKATGVKHPKYYRTSSDTAAESCNAVVSEVIDEYFRAPFTFNEIAESLGFFKLSKSAEAEESNVALLALFRAVCAADASANGFVQGRGWCEVRADMQTPVQQAWLCVCEQNFVTSRRCGEVDWMRLTGATEPVVFDIRAHGNNRVAIRFRNVTGDKVNKELI